MLANVPQFIDLEDRIVGPLTAKQLGWLGLGGVILVILWSVLSLPAFIVSAVLVTILFVGLAFYRPYNQPLLSFILSFIGFAFGSKMYIWKRVAEKQRPVQKIAPPKATVIQKKTISEEKIQEISKLLDTK